MFYRSIQNLDVLSNGDLDFVKTKINDAALNAFHFYNTHVPQHLYDKELKALYKFFKNIILVVQKEDKGSSLVLVNRDVYVNQMKKFSKATLRFRKYKN